MLAAAIPVLATGEIDIMRLIVGFGLGVPALLVLILSTWTINSANLYSASLSLTATFPQRRAMEVHARCGCVGCVASGRRHPRRVRLVPAVARRHHSADRGDLCDRRVAREHARRRPCIGRRSLPGPCRAGIALLANAGYFTLTTVPALDATLVAIVDLRHLVAVRSRV